MQVQSNTKLVSKVDAKFGRDDIRTIKFVARKNRVRVSCKGLPIMTVMQRRPGASDAEMFEAGCPGKGGIINFVTARTPEAAYKKAVRHLWKPIVKAN
jgi:hypothetical protein